MPNAHMPADTDLAPVPQGDDGGVVEAHWAAPKRVEVLGLGASERGEAGNEHEDPRSG